MYSRQELEEIKNRCLALCTIGCKDSKDRAYWDNEMDYRL
jgi:hypothetical protein